MYYIKVRVTKRYLLHNGTYYKTVQVQNRTCCTTARITKQYRYKTVLVAQRHVLQNCTGTKRYLLHNGTYSRSHESVPVYCTVVHIFSLVQTMPLRPVGLERGVFLDAVGEVAPS